MNSRRFIVPAALVVMTLALPSRADAQFGSIRDRLKKEVEKKAEEPAAEAAEVVEADAPADAE